MHPHSFENKNKLPPPRLKINIYTKTEVLKTTKMNNIGLHKDTVSTLVEHSSTQLINTKHRK